MSFSVHWARWTQFQLGFIERINGGFQLSLSVCDLSSSGAFCRPMKPYPGGMVEVSEVRMLT